MWKKDEKKSSEDVKADQPLQAILLADSFEKNFRPITLEKPKVLLPLVNTPMLEYTLEFLSQNGVEEVELGTTISIDFSDDIKLCHHRSLYSVYGTQKWFGNILPLRNGRRSWEFGAFLPPVAPLREMP